MFTLPGVGTRRVVLGPQEETFKVLGGKMGYFWESKAEPKVAEVGETITIPPGVKHTFFNADPDLPLEFDVSIKPAVSDDHRAWSESHWTGRHRLGETTVHSHLQIAFGLVWVRSNMAALASRSSVIASVEIVCLGVCDSSRPRCSSL